MRSAHQVSVVLLVIIGACFLIRGMSEIDSGDALHNLSVQVVGGDQFERQIDREEDALGSAEDIKADNLLTRTAVKPNPVDSDEIADPLVPETVLEGEFCLHELDGSERRDLSGRLDIIVWHGSLGTTSSAEIENGKWRIRIGEPNGTRPESISGRLGLNEGEIRIQPSSAIVRDDGNPISVLESNQKLEVGDSLIVHARRVRPLLVFVESKSTGALLDQVTIRSSKNGYRVDDQHPGDRDGSEILVANGHSPIEIVPSSSAAKRGKVACLVGSPGYAWTKVEIDLGAGGEKRVELERGGDLSVLLQGSRSPAGSWLRVRSADRGAPFANQLVSGRGPYIFEGLPNGEYKVCLEVGDWRKEPLILACSGAMVASNALESVTLTSMDSHDLILAPISGRLVLPHEWELNPIFLELRLLDTPLDGSDGLSTLVLNSSNKVAGARDTYAFDFGRKQVGNYELTLSRLQYSAIFQLKPDGRFDFVFSVPPPTEIAVCVISESTGQVANVDTLIWTYENSKDTRGHIWSHVVRAADDEFFRFRVPRSVISIKLQTDAYQNAVDEINVESGGRFFIKARPAIAAKIMLKEGGVAVEWPKFYAGDVKHIGGPGRLISARRRETGLLLMVSDPGWYRITFPEIPGYQKHEYLDLEFTEGSTQEVVVELEPS